MTDTERKRTKKSPRGAGALRLYRFCRNRYSSTQMNCAASTMQISAIGYVAA